MDLSTLNIQQKEAVLYTDGPLLVLAGAGTGKTKVLTTKIAYLIEEKGMDERDILAITFTNKAAKEMRDRVERLLGRDVSGMWIGTFHSIAVRLLRRHIDALGYDRHFSIYDRTDQTSLLKEVMKELAVYDKKIALNAILTVIAKAKEAGWHAAEVDANYPEVMPKGALGRVVERYISKMKQYNALDFDDLLLKTNELFRSHPDILRRYEEKFAYILIDEYQDTNQVQYDFAHMLARHKRNICAVGDADQSIYGWRGADISNILNFEQDYADTKTILLEENYRSTKPILDAANQVIRNNVERKDKNLWTRREVGEEILYRELETDREEASQVLRWILEMRREGIEDAQMAILYRTNAQSRIFEECFMANGLPYRVVGGLKFYDRKEIKDVIAYLRLLVNPDDDLAFKRIINTPKRGIGNTTLEKLERAAAMANSSIYDYLQRQEVAKTFGKAAKTLVDFRNLMETFRKQLPDYFLDDLVRDVVRQTGYEKSLTASGDRDDATRLENIASFIDAVAAYRQDNPQATLEDYMASVSLLSDTDKVDDHNSGVSMMTVHSAKGLEYPVVFLVGMEESLFPHAMSFKEDNIEEERRLCYVAITRAEHRLFLTSARRRFHFGEERYATKSRFLLEMNGYITGIGEQHMEDKKTATRPQENHVRQSFRESYDEKIERSNLDFVRESALKKKTKTGGTTLTLQQGDRVSHKKFGMGIVEDITRHPDGDEVVIHFEKVGIKKLNAAIAKLNKMEDEGERR